MTAITTRHHVASPRPDDRLPLTGSGVVATPAFAVVTLAIAVAHYLGVRHVA